MSASDWFSRKVSRFTAGEKKETKVAVDQSERAQAAPKKIAVGAGKPARSSHERLKATLSQKDEAL